MRSPGSPAWSRSAPPAARARVLLPKRPNESTGWIRADEVRAAARVYSAEVDLSARRLTLYQGAKAVHTYPVAIGQPDTPTPTGRFFVTVKLRPPQISWVYGAWALGLSAYSEVFDQLSSPSISTLASLLPLGSPVDIRA